MAVPAPIITKLKYVQQQYVQISDMEFRTNRKINVENMGKFNLGPLVQDMRSKHKQNWINHLERVDNTRLPKHALNYKPRGRRDRGRPRKRWQRVDAGTVKMT